MQFAHALAAAADRLAENDARPCATVRGRPCAAIADPTHTYGACSAVWHRATWHTSPFTRRALAGQLPAAELGR